MTYRKMVVETVKIACQDLMDRAEELIPDTEAISNIDVKMHIPSLTDNSADIPVITVTTNAYCRRMAMEKIFNLLNRI